MFRNLKLLAMTVLLASCGQESVSELDAVVDATTGRWKARHNMRDGQFQANLDQFSEQGFQVRNLSGYTVNGSPRFLAVWDSNRRDQVVRYGLTKLNFELQSERLEDQGYRLQDISGYEQNRSSRFAAIWVRDRNRDTLVFTDRSNDQFQRDFDIYSNRGYRLVNVSGYSIGGQARFASIWERRSGPRYLVRHGISEDGLVALTHQLGSEYRITDLTGYGDRGKIRFAVILERNNARQGFSEYSAKSDQYQRKVETAVRLNLRITHAAGYHVGSKTRYILGTASSN
ncbi:MAG: hypothetical protein HRU19_00905 [Pseudobacteriovorax sp.]|nr:hypothetical protein [Pseudobacteriovorax sp.]